MVLGVVCALCGWSAGAQGEGFMKRDGTKLTLDGKEVREISFNKFDLFGQFVLAGRADSPAGSEKQARAALAELGKRRFRTIRVNCSPFYPVWFNAVFFDADPRARAAKRKRMFERFDAMLDACDEHNIRVVASLMWNVHNFADLGPNSLAEGITDRSSPARRKVEEYIRAVVTRYRDRRTIAMWELGNEWNLFADLQKRWGVIPGKAEGDRLRPGPVVRDRRNNFTSDELAAACGDLARLIRSIDPNHLITTGHSTPRPAAMHLLRAARQNTRRPDWTKDSPTELAEHIRLTHPDPIDVISIHYYDDGMTAAGGELGNAGNLRMFKRIADEIGKPLLVGEIGLHAKVPRFWDKPEAISLLRKTLPVVVELKIPLTLYWTYADDRAMPGPKLYDMRPGKTDEALGLVEKANQRTK